MKFGRKAWIPWIISLVIDLLSNKLSKGQKKTNTDEAEELTRRKLLWIFYLIRPPFFEKIIWCVLYLYFISLSCLIDPLALFPNN